MVYVFLVLMLILTPVVHASGSVVPRWVPEAPPTELPSGPGDFDLIDGRFTMTFHPSRGMIHGEGVLWGRSFVTKSVFPFRLHPRALIEKISMPDGTALSYRRDGETIMVSLPERSRWGRHMGIHLSWAVKVGGPSMLGPLTPYITDRGAYLPADLLWHPRGMGQDVATWRCTVRTPMGWKVLPIGARVESYLQSGFGGGRFRIDQPIPGMALKAGFFDVRTRRPWSDGDVEVLVPPGLNSSLPDHADDVMKFFRFFARHLGEPACRGLTLVHLPGPLERAPFRGVAQGNLIGVSTPPETVAGPYLEFLATEAARSWFGRRLEFNDHLGDALSIYLGMLALRQFDGRRAFLTSARDKANRYRDAAAMGIDVRPSAIRGLGENVQRGVYDVVVKAKVPLLLLCLEQSAGGPRNFIRILRTLLTHYPDGGPVGWPDFMRVYEKRTGLDLSTFALLYVDGPGIPPEADSLVGFDVLPPDVPMEEP